MQTLTADMDALRALVDQNTNAQRAAFATDDQRLDTLIVISLAGYTAAAIFGAGAIILKSG